MSYLPPSNLNSFALHDITETDIILEFSKLNTNKSCSDEIIKASILKENKFLIAEPLSILYNLSLKTGKVPNGLKIAKVIPIFKKDDKTDLNNYRPISLLPTINKIFEKIICKRLLSFLTKHNFFYDLQFGFRKRYSTNLALFEIIENMYKWLDDGNYVAAIYLDIKKAFDSLDRNILLQKLYHYGIRGPAYDWFKDYLSDRQQFTVMGDVKSSTSYIDYGVPQGSILGPVLFLIFINDIGNVDLNPKPRLFADDTNLFLYNKNLLTLNKMCNRSLAIINEWLIANKLTLNIAKSKYCIFGHSAPLEFKFTVTLHNTEIEKISHIKYLGVFIDENLNWKQHISYVYEKCLKYIGIFYKLRSRFPPSAMRILYFAFVYPHIIYCLEIYANTYKSYLKDLIILNNKILRIVQNQDIKTKIVHLYRNFHTLPVDMLFNMQILLLMFKYKYYLPTLPPALHNFVISKAQCTFYETRQINDFLIERPVTAFGCRRLSYLGSKMWNELPACIKQSDILNRFKSDIFFEGISKLNEL